MGGQVHIYGGRIAGYGRDSRGLEKARVIFSACEVRFDKI
jgi:hypothetical protein